MSDWKTNWENPLFNGKYAYEHCHDHKARMETLARETSGFVLEIGCGFGVISDLVRKRGCTVVSSDISRFMCKRSKETYGLDVVCSDGRNLPFRDQVFDSTILGEVIEHCYNMGEILFEACRVTKQRIMASFPTSEKWENDPTHRWHIRAGFINGQDFLILQFTRIHK